MDEEFKGARKGKPQQQFYRPGGGLLKKNQDDIDNGKLEYQKSCNDPPRKSNRNRGGRTNHKDSNRHMEDISEKISTGISRDEDNKYKSYNKSRKPEQQIYVPKSKMVAEREESNSSPSFIDIPTTEFSRSCNIRYNEQNPISERINPIHSETQVNNEPRIRRYSGGHRRNAHDNSHSESIRRDMENSRKNENRQTSEPRNVSPSRKNMTDNHILHRNRDTRSMESSGLRHIHSNGGKPPSGRRNSTVASNSDSAKQNWFGLNIDQLPPRLKKKFLAENGQPRDGNGNMAYQPHSNYHSAQSLPYCSQTLPARGHSRIREEDFDIDKSKHSLNTFTHSFDSGSDSRSSTPHGSLNLPIHINKSDVIGSQENILIEKLTGQCLSKNNRFSNKSEDILKFSNQTYESSYNTYNSLYEDKKNPPLSKIADVYDSSQSFDSSNGKKNVSVNKLHSKVDNVMKSIEKLNSNKLLETISSSNNTNNAVNHQSENNFCDWANEMERLSSSENNLKEVLSNKKPIQNEATVTNSDVKQEKPQENKHGRGSRHGSERKLREGRSGKKTKKRNSGGKKNAGNRRSTSRSSVKRERSNDNNQNRSERSPLSRNRDVKDYYRDKENIGHRDVRDHLDKDSAKNGRTNNRGNHNENKQSAHQWPKNSYSRENSRERCFSRTNSGDRAGPGSRQNSRDRSRHCLSQPPEKYSIQRIDPVTNRVIIDPEKIKLPPPPPPMRNSRNQNRRDSWSGRGSRHASIESGTGDMAYSPPRGGGGGGGGGRRRRRRDSDHHRHSTSSTTTNWREEMPIVSDRYDNDSRRNIRTEPIVSNTERRHDGPIGKCLAPGIIVLPQDMSDKNRSKNTTHNQNRGNSNTSGMSSSGPIVNRTLYDYRNPSKPIVVSQTSRLQDSVTFQPAAPVVSGCPAYYDINSESFKSSHNQSLLLEIQPVDELLTEIYKSGTIVRDWDKIANTRLFLQRSLQILLTTDIKFCHSENMEQLFWKLLYYSIIENMRKTMTQDDTVKSQCIDLINNLIKDGNTFYENLLELLQTTYKFQLDDYLNAHYISPPKGLGFVGLALVSAQKIYINLGDLARYKELLNDTSNYAKSKNWYTKANQINPKNGRPYNQLAILAVYGRRKLDAVYYYMRSLMSSSPFSSARESLIGLFDENRKKYEASEKKRLAERQKAVEVIGGPHGLRREIWIRVGGGRTTTLLQADRLAARAALSDDEELLSMSSVDLNKRFITTYLHVHGKLITKIGMETLTESATMMLRQFRALLRLSPLPTSVGRLLQLTALNMFAIESAQLKESTSDIVGGGCRSEVQERALAVSLRMFGAMLERCCVLLSTPFVNERPRLPVHDDVIVLLPAIKVWCEWMLSHSNVWNPPPPCDDFDIGGETDPWQTLAKLMNLLEPLDTQRDVLKLEPSEEDEMVRLPEDTQLAGFTPLMGCAPEIMYAPRTLDPEAAKLAVRTYRLLFFGTEYLCGLDPPALERRILGPQIAEYVSVVRRRQPDDDRDMSRDRQELSGDSDIMEASMSEEEEQAPEPNDMKLSWAAEDANDEMTKKLLRRRGQLEHRRRDLERRRLRMQALLRQGQVSVELEVRPRYLVPDTNCFIDHLPRLQRLIAPEANTPYTLVVPLVVVSELEGLTRALRVGDAARCALDVLHVKRPCLRFATTRGNLLTTATFTAEQDGDATLTNDDRILATSLSLCRPGLHHQLTNADQEDSSGTVVDSSEVEIDGVKKLLREVVLLTDDRNLRVKALARDLPVRDLPAFMRWAAID